MNTVVLLQQNHFFVFKNIFSLSAFRNFNDYRDRFVTKAKNHFSAFIFPEKLKL